MARPDRAFRRLMGGTTIAAFLGLAWAAVPVATTQDTQSKPPKAEPAVKPAKKAGAIARLADPWPEPAALAALREEAEQLPLFQSAVPLPFRLTADLTAINKDRKPNSDKRFPGVLEIQSEGKPVSIPVELGSRGHARLNVRTCEVVPLRLEFAKKDVKGTVFEDHGELKLVTHCRNDRDHDQYILKEYLAYQVFRLFTPRSFRARLVQATYFDSAKNKETGPRYAMLIERNNDVAKRLEGRRYPLEKQVFQRLDQDSLVLMALLEYLIGNTDFSIYALHNVELVQDRFGKIYPVAYDFDYSGLVNAAYAVADRRLQLTNVRDRLYRGPCRTAAELEPFLARFREKKTEVLGLVDAVSDFKPAAKKEAREYLDEFFSIIEPNRVKRNLIDPCVKAGM